MVRGSSECGLRKEESVWRWGYFHCTLRTVSVWRRVFEWFRCLNFESVWETERVFERLRETVWVGVWNLHVEKIFHINRLANRVKWVLKARVLIESRVFKTRDAINIYCFKIGQLTILLDTLCYLARGFLFWQRYHPKKKKKKKARKPNFFYKFPNRTSLFFFSLKRSKELSWTGCEVLQVPFFFFHSLLFVCLEKGEY